MVSGFFERPDGKAIRVYQHGNSADDHPGEVEIRLLSEDHFGNHIRHVEQAMFISERRLGEILIALLQGRLFVGGDDDA